MQGVCLCRCVHCARLFLNVNVCREQKRHHYYSPTHHPPVIVMVTTYTDQRSSNGGEGSTYGGGGNMSQESNAGTSSLYATSSRVPLIKSPAVRVPPPIVLPNNLHPLPPNLQDYFVYPFNLERFVLENADKREKARKQDMLKRAPGWNEDGKVLEPTRRPNSMQNFDESQQQVQQTSIGFNERNEIDEIAEMLDRLDKR